MKRRETPISIFIRQHGGTQAIADAIGCSPGNVRMWNNRKRIPRRVWPDLIQAFPAITLDDLMALEPQDLAA